MKKNILTLQDHHLGWMFQLRSEGQTTPMTKLEVNVQLKDFTFPSGESIPWCLGAHPGTHSSRLQSLLKQVPSAQTLVEA